MVQFVNISHGANNLIHSQGVFLERLNYNMEKKGFINISNLMAGNVRKITHLNKNFPNYIMIKGF